MTAANHSTWRKPHLRHVFRPAIAVFCLVLLTACNSESTHMSQKQITSSVSVSNADWRLVSTLRIVFAHQSVGDNILSGVRILSKDHPDALVVERSSAPLPRPGIHHFLIGTNGDASGKIEAFVQVMRGDLGQTADVAILKLCFSDFTEDTDGRRLADQYIEALKNLERELPRTYFVPVTVPLTTVQRGPKAWIKKLIGRDPAGYAENARRGEFNERLRQNHDLKAALFDLASIESERGKSGIDYHGRRVETLNPSWTDDGGHLNGAGQVIVAKAFVENIANVVRQR